MGFNYALTPVDRVSCHFAGRQGIISDSDLVAGNVHVAFGFVGSEIRSSFTAPDGTGLEGLECDTGQRDGVLTDRWSPFGGGWQILGNQATTIASPGQPQMFMATDAPKNANFDIDCDISATVEAGLYFRQGGSPLPGQTQVAIIPPHTPVSGEGTTVQGFVTAQELVPGNHRTVLWQGTTPLVGGTMYNLRVTAVGTTYTVYLNNVLEGSFTGTWEPTGTFHGIYENLDHTTARFDNYRVRKYRDIAATSWILRNYDGDLLGSGTFTPGVLGLDIPDSTLTWRGHGPYGWYRLYLVGPDRGDNFWRDAFGECAFLRIPNSNLPANPSPLIQNISFGSDEISRGVLGLGSSRYAITTPGAAPSTIINELLPAVQRAKTWQTDTASPARPRYVQVAWQVGSMGHEATVTAVVAGLKDYVKVWECRNEPNFFDGPDHWVQTEFIPFANAVHAGDPNAIVIGPGSVSFNEGGLWYFHSFINTANGGAYADAFSFHPYNCYNGDVAGMRTTLGNVLALMATYGHPNYDMWMTEQGYGWNYRGVVWPHYATRWNSLMYFGQEVITHGRMRPETTCYWTDTWIGFDDFPMHYLTVDGPGPTMGPVRTMNAEIWNKTFTSELDFGTNMGNNVYLGGVWTDATNGNKVIGVQGASYGCNDIRFAVTGSTTFTRVDPWGNTHTLTASGGYVQFPVSELPQWLRVPFGTSAALVPGDWNWGTNACIAGTPSTSVTQYTGLSSVNNGVQDNGYLMGFSTTNDGFQAYPEPAFPQTVQILFASQAINRLLVHCQPPWQRYGTIVDMDIQTFDGTTWTTRKTWTSDLTRSYVWASAGAKCWVESYWQDQYIFDAILPTTITCQGVRCYIRNTSVGAFDSQFVSDLGDNGQNGWGHLIHIREIQAYNVTGAPVSLWPDDTNTGVLGASLTTVNVTGTLWRTSTDGSSMSTTQIIGGNAYRVFTNKRFVATTGYVYCDDPYVRFDHCSFTASGLINNTSAMVQASSACNAGIFDDCTFDGGAASHNRGLQFDHGDITVLRGNFTRTGNAAVEKNDTTGLWSMYVTDSYIHEVKGWPAADHADGLQMGAGKNFTAQHNTIWIEPFNGTDGDTANVSNSCIGLWAELGNVTGTVLINHNQMAGGGSCLYVEQKLGYTFQGSVTVSDNVFVRNHFPSLQGVSYTPTTGHAAIWYTLAPPGRPPSLSGIGSGWINNTWEDGTIVTLNEAIGSTIPPGTVPRLRNPTMGGAVTS